MKSARSSNTADPLSDAFALLDVAGARCTRLEAGGSWALRFPPKPALKFVALLAGECWLTLDGGEPTRMAAGDTFLLANAPGYVIGNDPERPPDDGIALFDWQSTDVAHHGGDDTVLLAGAFTFAPSDADLLFADLPPFMPIPAAHPSAPVLRGTLDILDREVRTDRIGASVVTRRLADILLVQALRAYAAAAGAETGWLAALGDRRIGAALRLIHGEPARRWTVAELSREVGMSRSAFALRFKLLVGVPPLAYALGWRMRLARHELRRKASVGEVAARLGYASESAFGHAFKRTYGHPPKRPAASDAAP